MSFEFSAVCGECCAVCLCGVLCVRCVVVWGWVSCVWCLVCVECIFVYCESCRFCVCCVVCVVFLSSDFVGGCAVFTFFQQYLMCVVLYVLYVL